MSHDGPAIRLRGVSKKYPIYARNTDRVLEALHPLGKSYHHDFWALRDIDLDIARGETFGIVGVNGCGKSTLLQVICSILQPTSGTVEVQGRVAALIELGAGFSQDLTGRQNVEMNCMIAGLSLRDARAVLPTIEAFADVGEFFDQPVKIYSSGMFMRVAFSTAVHVDPDILVIDEALAVGDARFQQKCFAKFRQFQQQGKTILLVTHDRYTLPRLCSRALMLHAGRMVEVGEPKQVTDAYSRFLQLGIKALAEVGPQDREKGEAGEAAVFAGGTEDVCHRNPTYNKAEHRYGKGGAAIIDYRLVSDEQANPKDVRADSGLEIRMRVCFDQTVDSPLVGFTVKTTDGVLVTSTHSSWLGKPLRARDAGDIAEYRLQLKTHLVPGEWFFSLTIAEDQATILDTRESLFHITVWSAHRVRGIASLEAVLEEDDE